ncbi:hypothetical protein [Vibrio sp. D431a]|uniref:hypothetical protein n=1 Tax=Vibrio sp. D431a TaxID=2837388 RepID=UPI0025558112|nr:hypothetical protein [Vibrio sp. D431a]MDK9793797.1 hypothetical protein [Vibrio sp. D431a]
MTTPSFTEPTIESEGKVIFNKNMIILGCPHCNSQPVIDTLGTECEITCSGCGFPSSSFSFLDFLDREVIHEHEFKDYYYEDKIRAMAERFLIDKWNTRFINGKVNRLPTNRAFQINGIGGEDYGIWVQRDVVNDDECGNSYTITVYGKVDDDYELSGVIAFDSNTFKSKGGWVNFPTENLIITEITKEYYHGS